VRPLDCGDLTRRPGDLAWPRYFFRGANRILIKLGSGIRVNYGFANRSPRVDRFPGTEGVLVLPDFDGNMVLRLPLRRYSLVPEIEVSFRGESVCTIKVV